MVNTPFRRHDFRCWGGFLARSFKSDKLKPMVSTFCETGDVPGKGLSRCTLYTSVSRTRIDFSFIRSDVASILFASLAVTCCHEASVASADIARIMTYKKILFISSPDDLVM